MSFYPSLGAHSHGRTTSRGTQHLRLSKKITYRANTHATIGTHHRVQRESRSPAELSCWCAWMSWVAPVGCSPLRSPMGSLNLRSTGRQGGLLPPCGGKRVVRRRRRGKETWHLPEADGLCLFAEIRLGRRVAGIPPHRCGDGENGSCHPVREQ